MSVCKPYYPRLFAHYRWLHQHPELSMEETMTSAYISRVLKEKHILCRPAGETGVIGTLMADHSCKTLAVRSEIDGLPIQEDTGLPYASLYPGKMHACGHDAITAVTLCLAEILSENREKLKYNVRFLFEPGEETGQGAKHMMLHKGLENPKVDGLLIFHFGNQETRHMEIQKSITTAAVEGITLCVKGKSCHWFCHEEGIDALYAASRLAVEIQKLNRVLKTEFPFVLGFGQLLAGNAGNIVADTAELYGSLRAFTKADMAYVKKELEKVIAAVEKETGAVITLVPGRSIPPMINDEGLVKKGTAIGRQLMKENFSVGEKPFLVGDNAAFYTERVPGMRAVFLAGREQEENYPVHNPGFAIDQQVMTDALEFLYAMFTTEEVPHEAEHR